MYFGISDSRIVIDLLEICGWKIHSSDTYDKFEAKIDGGIGFLFIDEDHLYSGVGEEFETYKGFVNEGGIIAFHDIQYEHSTDWSGLSSTGKQRIGL